MCESVRKYLIRLHSSKKEVTLEETVSAKCIGEAIKTAEAMKNDLNAKEGYAADFRVKAITIREV